MKVCLAVLSLLALTACTGSSAGADAAQWRSDERPIGQTLVYECLGYEFIARMGPGEMAVWLDDEYRVLSQVRSASGVKYQEGDIVFWSKGEDAMLMIGPDRYGDCALAPARAPWEDARRRGVNFRASGNEPGWYLELKEGEQILFVGNYGGQRLLLPEPGVQWDDGVRLYQTRNDAHEIILEIRTQTCRDSMRGDEYPATVSLLVDGRALSGCGTDLVFPWE
ncbi:MAG: MliC family protein [Pseudomonadota bacterium]